MLLLAEPTELEGEEEEEEEDVTAPLTFKRSGFGATAGGVGPLTLTLLAFFRETVLALSEEELSLPSATVR